MLQEILKETTTKEMLRVLNTNKEYMVINCNATNCGLNPSLICTNNYTKWERFLINYEDGYSCILEINTDLTQIILDILLDRLNTISNSWTKNCYHYNWDQFLKTYNMNENDYTRLLKLNNKIQG